MTDRGILFSAPMVRALLDGRKTQTRRLLKGGIQFRELMSDADIEGFEAKGGCSYDDPDGNGFMAKPGFAIRDRLWVRETWCDGNSDAGPVVCYRANHHRWQPPYTGPDEGIGPSFDYDRYPGDWCIWAADLESGSTKGWRSGRYMPRWASRLTLRVTDVRVQRLQDISADDAIAEGIEAGTEDYQLSEYWAAHKDNPPPAEIGAYAMLWERINGQDSWLANPWVVALTFTVEQRNIDARLAA